MAGKGQGGRAPVTATGQRRRTTGTGSRARRSTVTPAADADGLQPAGGEQPGAEPAGPWLPLTEAAEQAGVSVAALRKWYRADVVPSRLVPGPRGDMRQVPLDAVLARAERTVAPRRAAAAEATAPRAEVELAPLVHRMEGLTAQLVDASERAARAEVRAEMLGRQLVDAQGELERVRRQLDEATRDPAEPVGGERRTWWRR